MPQKVISASSPNPVGSGARAIGMGGAFIAVADDATAASWNPAGLTQLKKPEVSFAFSYLRRRDDYSSSTHPETAGVQKNLSKDLNYLSIVYPLELFERNMTLSLNYQLLYEFDRDIRTSIYTTNTKKTTLMTQKIKFHQRGTLKTLSPAYAIQITPNFSLGTTFNIWTDKLFWSNGWTSDTSILAKNYLGGRLNNRATLAGITKQMDHDRYSGFSGFNMNLGFLWNINRFFTLGGVVKTPFTADLDHERVVTIRERKPGQPSRQTRYRQKENVDLDMPLSYGLGLAVRFSDRLTMSLDVYRTEWDHFKLTDGRGNRINPITGRPTRESKTDGTNQVRLGGEYLFIFPRTVIPVRWGLFYDPEPSENNPEDFWGCSLGSGISIGDLIFDCAYQFRYGKDVRGDVFFDYSSISADVEQHLLIASFIYHF